MDYILSPPPETLAGNNHIIRLSDSSGRPFVLMFFDTGHRRLQQAKWRMIDCTLDLTPLVMTFDLASFNAFPIVRGEIYGLCGGIYAGSIVFCDC